MQCISPREAVMLARGGDGTPAGIASGAIGQTDQNASPYRQNAKEGFACFDVVK
jgi:hypothetical protein